MALAPEISAFGDGDHLEGETGLTVDGGGFGAFPGSLWMFENADGSGAADELTVGAWNDIQIAGVEIPASPNNVPGTVYLRVLREDLAWSQGFAFTLTASGPDTTPNQFMFVDHFGVELSTVVTSAPITVTGINTTTDIEVADGEYNINGGAFTSTPGTVENGDEVRARHTSAADYLTQTDTIVTIGGVSDTFSSRTRSLFGVTGAGMGQIWTPDITGPEVTGGPGIVWQ